MDQIHIRTATKQDLDRLLRFEQGVIEAERPFDSTLKEGPIHYYELEAMLTDPHIELVVAELNGALIGSGYARIEGAKHYLRHSHHAYLGFMYVDPAHRGKGINKMIVDALKQWAIAQKMTELRLDVYYDNHNAIKAYEKAGFSKHMVEMRMGL